LGCPRGLLDYNLATVPTPLAPPGMTPPQLPTILDLFAGAGGMALGFHGAGGRCIGAVEYDQAAAHTFALNVPGDPKVFGGPEEGDVNLLPVPTLLAALPSRPQVVVGGPPCQGFSRIGKAKQASLLVDGERIRKGGVTDPGRNLLYQYFLAVVRHAQPLAFVMENVPGMREHLGNDFARRISREAHYLGYNVRYFLLNAAHYGVPQHRWRLFFIGLRSDLGHNAVPRAPAQTHFPENLPADAPLPEDPWLIAGPDVPVVASPRPLVGVRDALADLPKLKYHLGERPAPPPAELLPLKGPPSDYVKRLRDWPGLPVPDLVSGNWYRFTRRDFPIFRNMAQGDCYPEALEVAHSLFRQTLEQMAEPPLPGTEAWEELKAAHVPPYRNDAFHDKWQKLVADRPSWTLTAHLSKDTYSHIHYDSRQARTISIREAARLQSFPDGVEFVGNHGDHYRQIGNAVPPLLARAIAEELFSQLRELGAL
jgi:DNA (cytosine-5)-methyltransferase 1